MTEWEKICDYLLHHEDCEPIHKFGWPTEGWIYITTNKMKRVRIDPTWTLDRVMGFVQKLLLEEDY